MTNQPRMSARETLTWQSLPQNPYLHQASVSGMHFTLHILHSVKPTYVPPLPVDVDAVAVHLGAAPLRSLRLAAVHPGGARHVRHAAEGEGEDAGAAGVGAGHREAGAGAAAAVGGAHLFKFSVTKVTKSSRT